jgi:cytochrome c peroxidase
VTIWDRDEPRSGKGESPLRLQKTVDLAFEPRLILPVDYKRPVDANSGFRGDGKSHFTLIVTDAFGGKLGTINPYRGNQGEFNSYEHNFGGLTYSPERYSIFFTHQELQPRSPITAERLSRGLVISNCFTEWDTEVRKPALTRTGPPSMKQTKIGHPASGDPAGIALIGSQLLVCLAGVDEVWLSSPAGEAGLRHTAGKRPRFITTQGQRAICLGELDDSLTLLEIKGAESTGVTSLLDRQSAQRELTPAERGERLFFSAKNSTGQQISCHSCHPDGHTNGLLADTLGDNTHGTPKRVLTLRGTRLTDLWAWNGEMKTLQDNVHKSLQETMHAPQIEPADVDDLVSFLHTLPPVPPLKPTPKDAADRELVERGRKIFHREACDQCHVPPLTYTSHASYDVGLADEKGLKKFNPPSLRGVGRLKFLLHDNRARSLREVFETHGHQLKEPLPEEELQSLIRFLESL